MIEIIGNLEKQCIIRLDAYLGNYLFRQNLRKHNGRICSEEDNIVFNISSTDVFYLFHHVFPFQGIYIFIVFSESARCLCVIVS